MERLPHSNQSHGRRRKPSRQGIYAFGRREPVLGLPMSSKTGGKLCAFSCITLPQSQSSQEEPPS